MTERYPEPFHTADVKATRWRDTGRVLVAGALGASVAAAGLEIVDWKHGKTDWAAFASAVAFGIAFLLSGALAAMCPERRWHALRAVAESARGAAWQHALAMAPFDGSDADTQLEARLQVLCAEGQPTRLRSGGADYDLGVPPDRADRIRAYAERRLAGQITYYGRKARSHRIAHWVWSSAALLLQLGGIVAALARAFWQFETDLLGIAATGAAAATAWTRARDHAELADVYAQTRTALEDLAPSVDPSATDVDEALARMEALMAGEHSRWLARRRVLGLSVG